MTDAQANIDESESRESGLSAHTVAARLRELADQVVAGRIQTASGSLEVPSQFMLKIELEEVQNTDGVGRELEIELEWPIQWEKKISLPPELQEGGANP